MVEYTSQILFRQNKTTMQRSLLSHLVQNVLAMGKTSKMDGNWPVSGPISISGSSLGRKREGGRGGEEDEERANL